MIIVEVLFVAIAFVVGYLLGIVKKNPGPPTPT